MSSRLYNTIAQHIGQYVRRLMRGGWYDRYAILSFEDEGMRVMRVRHNVHTKQVFISFDVVIPHVTEHTMRRNRAMRTFLSLAFFPFSYRVCVIIPHHMGRSYSDTLRLVRSRAHDPVTQEELDRFFAHQLGANVEARKKESMRRLHCDDVDVLLVENRIVAVRVDAEPLNLTVREESVVGKKGKEIMFNVIHTFMRRGAFSALRTMLPKRAHIYTIMEEGFCVPIQITRSAWESQSLLSHISFVAALVRRQGTDLFVCGKGSVSYYDTIPTGYQSMYEILNTRLGLNQTSFDALIARMGDDSLSPHLKKQLQDMLSHEIDRMVRGLQAAKRETSVRGIVCAPEGMRGYLYHDTRMKRTLIDTDTVSHTQISMPLSSEQSSVLRTARVAYLLETPRAHDLNATATRHIRWLLPHVIEISKHQASNPK